jgi:hypothetical protein
MKLAREVHHMTVRQLIEALKEMPEHLPVSIWAYTMGTDDDNREYIPQLVEGLRDGDDRRSVVLHASLGKVEPIA